MKTLVLDIPDSLDVDKEEVARILATQLYEQGKLSLGQAADLVGLDKRAFMELLGKYGVSVFNYSESDLAKDMTAQEYRDEIRKLRGSMKGMDTTIERDDR